jgi:hypothetical protein
MEGLIKREKRQKMNYYADMVKEVYKPKYYFEEIPLSESEDKFLKAHSKSGFLSSRNGMRKGYSQDSRVKDQWAIIEEVKEDPGKIKDIGSLRDKY